MSTNRPPSCDLPTLKPCPFCGSPNVEMRDGYDMPEIKVYAHCNNCEADGPWVDTDAGGKWNSIPRHPEVLELLDKIEWVACEPDELNKSVRLMSLLTMADKLRKEIGE